MWKANALPTTLLLQTLSFQKILSPSLLHPTKGVVVIAMREEGLAYVIAEISFFHLWCFQELHTLHCTQTHLFVAHQRSLMAWVIGIGWKFWLHHHHI